MESEEGASHLASAASKYDRHPAPLQRLLADTSRPTQCPLVSLPLSEVKNEFRLCRIQSYENGAKMHVEVAVFPMDKCPRYIALSYQWGSNKSKCTIRAHQGEISVTKNLHDFLLAMRESIAPQTWFWADQICIDQGNIEERNLQVSLMADIFSGAEEVCAYLGAQPEGVPSGFTRIPDKLPKIVDISDQSVRATILGYLELLSRSYWSRLWIVQELYLARKLTFYCGITRIPRQDLHHILKWTIANRSAVFRCISKQQAPDHGLLPDHFAFFESFHARVEALISQRAPSTGSNSGSPELIDVLWTHRQSLCADSRDKIFGLQALVENSQRVGIDYSKTLERLVLEVILKSMERAASIFRLAPLTMEDHFELQDQPLSVETVRRLRELANLWTGWPQLFDETIDSLIWSLKLSRMLEKIGLTTEDGCDKLLSLGQNVREWIREMLDSAVSNRQKTIAAAMLEAVEKATLHADGATHCASTRTTDMSEDSERVEGHHFQTSASGHTFDLSKRLRDLVAKHGFAHFGSFLYHPSEWPLGTEGWTQLERVLAAEQAGAK